MPVLNYTMLYKDSSECYNSSENRVSRFSGVPSTERILLFHFQKIYSEFEHIYER